MRLALTLRTVPALAALVALAACSSDVREPEVWFVHATDPHLFESQKYAPPTVHESANQRAFGRLLDTLDAVPGSDAKPEFLVLTGDLGLGEDETLNSTRQERVKTLAEIFSRHPGLDVYIVPGNNDVAGERADGLEQAHALLADVQKEVESSDVSLHVLTGCFLDEPGGSCTADIEGTSFRLIGFPTFSFKRPKSSADGEKPKPAADGGSGAAPAGATPEPPPGEAGAAPEPASTGESETGVASPPEPPAPPVGDAGADGAADAAEKERRNVLHDAWTATLDDLVAAARRDGKRVLLATHIADLNDPYDQALGLRSEAANRTETSGRPAPWAAWDVPAELFTRWRDIVGSPAVARVLAGHFHDSHRELYRVPYRWEREPAGVRAIPRADRSKIWIAPPLAGRLQDSPFQARGFALVRLAGSESERRLYWYDQEANKFEPDLDEDAAEGRRSARAGRRWVDLPGIRWLWTLGDGGTDLGKAAVLAIALLLAFLTVVAIWQIPPSTTPLAEPGKTEANSGTQPAAAPSSTGVFNNNFSRTVLSGLGGMAGVVVIEDLWDNEKLDKLYYIVCFVVLFLSLLVLSALLRGLIEALRSRVAARNFDWSASPQKWPATSTRYWVKRFWIWLKSLRPTGLVFLDTTLNVLQGKNQLETFVLGETIVDLQKSLVATVDRIAEELERTIRESLERAKCAVDQKSCRVNVSVLSRDESSLYYVSLGRGSLLRRFERRSVAWIATVAATEARWWRKSYGQDAQRIVLYDNSEIKLSGLPEQPLSLSDCLDSREPRDYQAFVVLPLPWFRGGRVKLRGAVHISFSEDCFVDHLWDGLGASALKRTEAPKITGFYSEARQLLRFCGSETKCGSSGAVESDAEPTAAPETSSEGPPAAPNPEPADEPSVCIKDPRLQEALAQALAVLPEILSEFNEAAFEHLVRPRE